MNRESEGKSSGIPHLAKTSEIWATRPSLGNQVESLETLLLAFAEAAEIFGHRFFVPGRHRRFFRRTHLPRSLIV
jgi:hypothetical protein